MKTQRCPRAQCSWAVGCRERSKWKEINMKTTSEAEPFRPQAQKGNKNKYTPGWNWFGDKEYDPACLLTLLQLSSEEWHLARISLAGWYIVRKCVYASEYVLQTGGEKKIKPTSLHTEEITYFYCHIGTVTWECRYCTIITTWWYTVQL